MEEQLSFYTNEELVKELLARSSFAGIIVKPRGPLEELVTDPVIKFEMFWSQKLPESTLRKILSGALEKIGETDV